MKHVNLNFFYLFLLVFAFAASCSGDNKKLTIKSAKAIIEKSDPLFKSEIPMAIQVGEYDTSVYGNLGPHNNSPTGYNTSEGEVIIHDACMGNTYNWGLSYGCIECLRSLDKEGLIKLDILNETEHRRANKTYVQYRVNVSLTPESEKKYLYDMINLDSKTLAILKGYKMFVDEVYDLQIYETGNYAECRYTVGYKNISPFAEIMLDIKEGTVVSKDKYNTADFKYYVEEGWKYDD